MRKNFGLTYAIYTALAAVCLFSAMSIAQAPAPAPPEPVMPPSLPATHVVDLMTARGSAAFGAQWKTMEAKIINVKPIPEALPGYKTAYDIEPHAGESGFDDTKWPTIEAKDLAARRSGGHVAFISATTSAGEDRFWAENRLIDFCRGVAN